jgi:hypothetical protein
MTCQAASTQRTLRLILFFVAVLTATTASYGSNSRMRFLLVQPNATQPPQIEPRAAFSKPSHYEIASTQDDHSAVIKFTDGTAVRLSGDSFGVEESQLELDRAIRYGVTRVKLDYQLILLNSVLKKSGVSLAPLLSASIDALREERRIGETRTRRELPDLTLFLSGHLSERRYFRRCWRTRPT